MTTSLYAPAQAGAIELRNRVVMAPMTRSRADRAGVPSPLAVDYYRQRAGAGLIVTEATQVSQQGRGYIDTPGIFADAQVAGWRAITRAVHEAGGRIALQLWHVGRISHPSFQPGGGLPVAPSAIAPKGQTFTYEGMQPFGTPRALGTDEIAGLVEQFRVGAAYAREAGFDGVEIHAANGYLIDQFLRDCANQRTDRYGGGVENRARFLMEVAEAVVGVWGKERVGVRLSPLGSFNSMADSAPEAHFRHIVGTLAELDLAYLHLVENGGGERPSEAELGLINRIKAGWRGFYIASAGYDRERAEAAVASGHADAVAFARAYISNPDLAQRLRTRAALAPADPATFYGGDAKGYTDYPPLAQAA